MLRLGHLRTDIEQFSQYTVKTRQNNTQRTERALQWLAQAPAPAFLRERLWSYATTASTWHGALPMTDAPLMQHVAAGDLPPEDTTVIAVDGSQIYPDRHAAVLYYLIQVGSIIFRYNGQAPTQHSRARLYFRDHEIYDEDGQIVSARHISIQRTLAELDYLAKSVEDFRDQGASCPILALLDGPLLWSQQVGRRRDSAALRRYLQSMHRIQRAGGIPVGFVERPSGQGLITLLWTAQQILGRNALAPDQLEADMDLARLGKNPLHTLTDQRLMQHVLAPGERGTWLQRISPINLAYAEEGQAIWHCYLNLGEEAAYPIIARVEIPAWAAQNEAWSTLLHTTLRHQSHLLRGNPYVLARAHEIALVTTQDKAALDALLQRTLWQAGVPVRVSEKARQKRNLRQRT